MAVSGALCLLLSALLLVSCSSTTAQIPSTVNDAEMTALQYWKLKLGHINESPPDFFVAKLPRVDYFPDHLTSSSINNIRMVTHAMDSHVHWAFDDTEQSWGVFEWGHSKANPVIPRSPGSYFRERDLKKGTTLLLHNVTERFPNERFLPRSVSSKIPFSASAIGEIFDIPADAPMGKAIGSFIDECEYAPSNGEAWRCVTSAEDMIDHAIVSLGSNNIVVKSMENSQGSGSNIVIGDVKLVHDGKSFPKPLTCHQMKFPYSLYYCHPLPEARLYEVEILDVQTKKKINSAPAVCHFNTTLWDPKSAPFKLLGSAPGKIEVCHWVFQGEMIWRAVY